VRRDRVDDGGDVLDQGAVPRLRSTQALLGLLDPGDVGEHALPAQDRAARVAYRHAAHPPPDRPAVASQNAQLALERTPGLDGMRAFRRVALAIVGVDAASPQVGVLDERLRPMAEHRLALR